VTALTRLRALCIADVMVTCPKTHSPDTELGEIRALFDDVHVHMALIVAPGGRLLTTIERSDLPVAALCVITAGQLGTLTGRTAGPDDDLEAATAALTRDSRRRVAVVDCSGRLLGLLCRKNSGTGYCSDEGIRQRAAEREGTER
jgi:CBS-domain-containing membrane protein